MAELSEKELLLLDNFMYISASAETKGTVESAVKEMLAIGISEENLSGGITVEEAKNILQEIQSNENLKITSSIDNEGIRASCFVDNQGNATVAFCGTGDFYEAW